MVLQIFIAHSLITRLWLFLLKQLDVPQQRLSGKTNLVIQLPLHPLFSRYGQLSGLVEPVAGLLGAALVAFIVPILPYALAFAAVQVLL